MALDRAWHETDVSWAAALRPRLIFDFKGWRTPRSYDLRVKEILEHLRQKPSS